MKVKDGLMLCTCMKLMLHVGYSSCGKTKSNSEFGFNDLKSLILMNSIYIYIPGLTVQNEATGMQILLFLSLCHAICYVFNMEKLQC